MLQHLFSLVLPMFVHFAPRKRKRFLLIITFKKLNCNTVQFSEMGIFIYSGGLCDNSHVFIDFLTDIW